MTLEFIYRTERFGVVNKPAGLLSCPGKTVSDSVQTRVPLVVPGATGPILGHRLDQATSGLLLVAFDAATHRDLRLQFEAQTITKQYIARLHGRPTESTGTIRLPQRLDIDHRPYQIIDPVHGKWGETHYEVLGHEGDITRVLFAPRTGRTHQLRVHARYGLLCPIVGDALYGDLDRPAARMMLHASRITFVDPGSQERVTVSSPAPF